jgi:hypothetical protein
VVARALDQRQALAVLRQRPELLYDFVQSPASWLNRSNELLPSLSRATGSAAPPADTMVPWTGDYDHLFAPPRLEG